MTPLEFTLVVFAVSMAAGVLGSLLGLGGGIIVVPVLTLLKQEPTDRPPSAVRALARATAKWFSVNFGPPRELSLRALGYRDQGYDCLKEGDYEQALRHANMVIQLHRAAPQGFRLRAHVCRLNGNTDQGIADATECIRLCTEDDLWILIDAYCIRAELFLTRKQWGMADDDATEAIRLSGAYIYLAAPRAWAHRTRGNARLEQGDFAAAIGDFSDAFRLDPHDFCSFRQRAYCRFRQGDLDQAINDCTEAIRLDPQQAAWCCAVRAAAHLGKGELDEAISSSTDAIRRDREFALAYSNRGEAHRRKGNYAAAAADFTQALQLNPADAEAIGRMALVREV